MARPHVQRSLHLKDELENENYCPRIFLVGLLGFVGAVIVISTVRKMKGGGGGGGQGGGEYDGITTSACSFVLLCSENIL